jgi:hypothetical protein
MSTLDPYEAFDLWMRENGFADAADSKPEDVDLERLHEAVEMYGRDGDGK